MTGEETAAYLIFDIETVPDGELLRRVRYPSESLTPAQAVIKARDEQVARTAGKSDFVPVSFQYPVAVCVARVRPNFELEAITCLDAPLFRPREIVDDFWRGLAHYRAPLVSFNGRGFDLPVLELAAFRYGISAGNYFSDKFGRRYRYGTAHLDLYDWLTNHGACQINGGLDLLSKLLGKPGKFHVSGKNVWDMFERGEVSAINDYCMYDVLDTYFVFLRTRVMSGEIDLPTEQDLMHKAREWIEEQLPHYPHLRDYLANWGDWTPWI